MTKDVLVSISGLHADVMQESEEENEAIEVVNPANYYFRNGKHYIVYDEPVEGMSGTIKNKLKITDDNTVEIMKSGISNAHMIFEKKKKNQTYYSTPYGQMLVGVNTKDMKVDVKENRIDIQIDYELHVNHEAVADSTIKMNIISKADYRRNLAEMTTI